MPDEEKNEGTITEEQTLAESDLDIQDPGEEMPPRFTSDVSSEDADPTPSEPTRQAPENAGGTPFPEDLMNVARNLGIGDDEAKAFGTPDKLAGFLRKALGHVQQQSQSQPSQQQPQGFDLNLDDSWEPEVKKVLTQMHEHYRAQIQSLQQHVGYVVGHTQEQQQREFRDWFDKELEGLGDDYAEVFGKGKSEEMRGTDSHTNRMKLAEAMDTIEAGLRARNVPLPGRDRILRQALAMAFSDKIEGNVRRKVGDALKRKQGQALPRPVGRNGKPQDPTRSAVAAVTEFMREHAMGVDD